MVARARDVERRQREVARFAAIVVTADTVLPYRLRLGRRCLVLRGRGDAKRDHPDDERGGQRVLHSAPESIRLRLVHRSAKASRSIGADGYCSAPFVMMEREVSAERPRATFTTTTPR